MFTLGDNPLRIWIPGCAYTGQRIEGWPYHYGMGCDPRRFALPVFRSYYVATFAYIVPPKGRSRPVVLATRGQSWLGPA
jgi:hypothetical protein